MYKGVSQNDETPPSGFRIQESGVSTGSGAEVIVKLASRVFSVTDIPVAGAKYQGPGAITGGETEETIGTIARVGQ
jgi:hypothetical protein